MLKQREIRRDLLGDELYDGPAWDVILDLYIAHEESKPISLTGVGLAGGVPATTALRWIRRLDTLGYISRLPDPADGRRTTVALTPKILRKVKLYFSRLRAREARPGGAGSGTYPGRATTASAPDFSRR